MKRHIVYPGSIPLDTDLLSTNKNAMVGLAFAMQAILGVNTLVDGLDCAPTSPASMQVTVAPGSIYSLQNTDATAYGSLAADTTHSIVKQGISYSALTFNCPAPVTTGQSVVYLIQAIFAESDTTPVTLGYYNSSNPSAPYSGPANSGTPQNTVRDNLCTVSIKTGTAATTGTQTAPAPDAGNVGLWTITVANGQTTVTSGNIAVASGAPFIGAKLTGRAKAGANTDITSLASPVIGAATATTPSVGDISLRVATTQFCNPAYSLTTNGYVKFSSGLILQWGTVVGATTVTFPISFPTACLNPDAICLSTNTGGPDVAEITSFNGSGMVVVTSRADTNTVYTSGTFYWTAYGN